MNSSDTVVVIGGSSGMGLAVRPAPGGSLAASVNGALESMVRAFALELAPIRVNAVSPGWVDTPVWDQLPTSRTPSVT